MSTASEQQHVLSFRFAGWSGFPDLLLNLLPERFQPHVIIRRLWPAPRPEGCSCYVHMPGALYRALPGDKVRLATVEERRDVVRGSPI